MDNFFDFFLKHHLGKTAIIAAFALGFFIAFNGGGSLKESVLYGFFTITLGAVFAAIGLATCLLTWNEKLDGPRPF